MAEVVMAIFTVEVRLDSELVQRFVALPFHREGDELINTDGFECVMPRIGWPRLRYLDAVSELLLGESAVNGAYPEEGPLLIPAGDVLVIKPGSLRISFGLLDG
jgi:hypothetical protein